MTKYSHTWAFAGDISHSSHCSLCGGRPNFYLNEHPESSAIMRTINLIAQLPSLQDLLTNRSWFLLYANPFPGARGRVTSHKLSSGHMHCQSLLKGSEWCLITVICSYLVLSIWERVSMEVGSVPDVAGNGNSQMVISFKNLLPS